MIKYNLSRYKNGDKYSFKTILNRKDKSNLSWKV